MDSRSFLVLAKQIVVRYLQDDTKEEDVYIVWSCKTLQNNKAMLGSDTTADYFEVTYNGLRNELYLDVYSKVDHTCIPLGEDEPVVPDQQHRIITGVVPGGDLV